ncbi:MAG: gliding motility-associated ABC transporter ATP-binding subunit GldA [Flavobacteriales bacterium]|nr:gliding motility-associated ABC transporter ATP-binding subunit GldA [Flavobacteriales bacterium]
MSIEVKEVSKIYGDQKALDQVSFSIDTGEIVGFLGPNGAGKSTMMKILTCYLPQTAGKVKVNGFDVEEESMKVREQVGYLPEHNPLYLDMYVREFLTFVAGLSGAPTLRVDEMIERTGLTPEKHKKIEALSKGYRQRVGLAAALLHDSKVLILDEPTTGLDPNQIVEIRDLIKAIAKDKTIMLSTHIMQEVEAICDRVIIINKGRIVADKPTEELSKLTSNRQVVKVEFEDKVDTAALKILPGADSVRELKKNTYSVESASGKDLRKALFRFAVEQDTTILEIAQESKSLERVFQELTK